MEFARDGIKRAEIGSFVETFMKETLDIREIMAK
jgi:hypothetical protein